MNKKLPAEIINDQEYDPDRKSWAPFGENILQNSTWGISTPMTLTASIVRWMPSSSSGTRLRLASLHEFVLVHYDLLAQIYENLVDIRSVPSTAFIVWRIPPALRKLKGP